MSEQTAHAPGAIRVRPAGHDDAPALRALLDAIVRRGGTTAIEHTPGVLEFADWFIDGEGCLTCFVAEADVDTARRAERGTDDGPGAGPDDAAPLGFQAIGTHDALPVGCGDIATFVRVGHAGHGIGRALFERSLSRARELGFEALNATIRADNAGGLAFYAGLGFVEHDVARGVPLSDGTPVDRVSMRYPL